MSAAIKLTHYPPAGTVNQAFAAMPDRLRSSAMLHFSVKNISAEERAKSCETMTELRDRVAALDGEQPVQLRMYLPHQKTRPPTEAAFRGLGVQLP